MKFKFIFGAAISTMLFGVAVAGLSQLPQPVESSSKSQVRRNRAPSKASYGPDDFADSVEITRDDLLVDVQSVTTTPASKSVTLAFSSYQLTGWTNQSKNDYVIIDDDDFSGSTSNPSLSNTPHPVFNGYTVEMDYNHTFTLVIGSGASKVETKVLVVPEKYTYGDSFAIENKSIYKDAFIFTDSDRMTKPEGRLEKFVIPDGIEVIESGAFQNVPDFIHFYCEATERPAGWASDWCDANSSQITWGYSLIDPSYPDLKSKSEVDFLTQPTGSSGSKSYGNLVKAATNDTSSMYFVVDDPNFTGDFDNPAKQGVAPYDFDGYVYKIVDTSANPNPIIPEKVTYNDVTINITKVPANVVNFNYQSHNEYELTITQGAPITAVIDPATFDYYYPEAKAKTYFKYVVNTKDPTKSSWTLSGKTVDLANYGITVTGTPENNNQITVSKTVIEEYVGGLQSITIPQGIIEVANGAFTKVPESVTLKCEYNAASGEKKQPLWGDTWVIGPKEGQVVWNIPVSEGDKTLAAASVSNKVRLSNEAPTYIIGYKYARQDKYWCKAENTYYVYEELVDGKSPKGNTVVLVPDSTPEYDLPLVVSYDVRDGLNNLIRTVYHEMPLLSEEPTSTSVSYFDSVAASTFGRSLDVLLADNEYLDEESFRVHNVFKAKFIKVMGKGVSMDGEVVDKVLSYVVPDVSVNFSSDAPKRFEREININEVVKYRYKGLTSFSDYFVTAMEFDKVLPSYWYTGIGADVASEYQEFIDRGEYSIRYALYDLQNSFYRITYYSPTKHDIVTTTIYINTPNGVVVLDKTKGNQVSFIVKNTEVFYKDEDTGKEIRDFKVENLRQFEIIGLTINIHLWNNASNIKVGRTDYSVHFGAVDVMPLHLKAPEVYKIETFIWIFVVAYTVVFAATAVVLFFYLRNKFKNDEFRRMKPKQYVKTAILGYLGSLVIALTIVFVAFRAGRFSNSVAAHNPIDIFIVIPGVVSVVVIGYFIKFMVTKIKANNQRKTIKKLKLNEDTKDDGTN